jgi:sugar phosphate isomerase/epimerase
MKTNSVFLVKMLVLVLFSASAGAQTDIGVQLYSFRNEFTKDVPGTFEKISKMGIRYLEGGGTYGMSTEDFKAMLKKNNLEVVSIGASFEELEKNPQAVVESAKAQGVKYVVCFWIPHTGNDFTVEDANKAITVFNSAGKVLADNGINLCYHPHGYEFRPYNNETLFDHLTKNLNPAYANYEMDVFWIKHPGQDPLALLRKYPNRFKLMHLKDRKPGTPGNQNGNADVESNVVLGQGDVGIADLIKEARKLGLRYLFIEDESSRSMEQVPESLKFIRSVK